MRLALFHPVLNHQLGQEAAVHAPGHVVTRRDRQEGAGVVVETDGVVVFGVSAFGTDLGLRIMEGLGLVAVT